MNFSNLKKKIAFKNIESKNVFYFGLIALVFGILAQIASRVFFLFNYETPMLFTLSTYLISLGVMVTVGCATYVMMKIQNKKQSGELKDWFKQLYRDFNRKVEPQKSKRETRWEEDEQLQRQINSLDRLIKSKS